MAQYSNVSPESLDPEQCDFSNIDYDQVNEQVIRDFGEKCLKPMSYLTDIFLEIRKRLENLIGKTLAEVREQGEYLLYYFLSGVNKNGEYEKGKPS